MAPLALTTRPDHGDAAADAAGDNEDQAPSTLWSRRDFFSLAGWAGVPASLGAALVGFDRFMFPRALCEPPPQFGAGPPDSSVSGAVDEWGKTVCLTSAEAPAEARPSGR